MVLLLGYDALRLAVAEVDVAVATLDEACRRSADDVDRLLDGGWRGPAATAFGSAWADWLAGASEVRAALCSIGEGISAARGTALTADTTTTSEVVALHERLGR
jgi:WXG100 family type VII secretion target